MGHHDDRPASERESTVSVAADGRSVAGERFGAAAAEIVAAADAMVGPLGAGATLSCLGTGVSAADAAHVAVEFLHPVIVGKRSIPARALDPARDRLDPGDGVAIGLRLDAASATSDALASARSEGWTTVDVHAGSAAAGVHHSIDLRADDAMIAREHQVTTYHVLWELVHELLDAEAHVDRDETGQPDDLGALYPFLFDGPAAGGDVADHTLHSARSKIDETVRLRGAVLAEQSAALVAAAAAVRAAVDAGGRLWTFGNGGSSTDARALAHLLAHGDTGAPVPAAALTDDVATLTALANDVSFDVVFARMLRSLARPGDVAVALSTSGGSANVLAGIEAARAMGIVTIGFAGYDGGDMAGLDALDHLFVVPSSSVHRIQEAQTTLLHVLTELVRSPAR